MDSRLFITALTVASISGCVAPDLNEIRIEDRQHKWERESIGDARAKLITENESIYSDQLECLGHVIRKAIASSKKDYPRISVDQILDKTGKVYPTNSTALSDIVINSLTKMSGFEVVETPLSQYGTSESRNNLVSANYPIPDVLKKNAMSAMGRSSTLPLGILFPSTYYITGALVQYDEGTEIDDAFPSTSVDIDVFKLQSNTSIVTTGIQLRLINSETGDVVTNTARSKSASVLLSNRFYRTRLNANLFHLVHTDAYGIDYDVVVSDPKHYAVQEIIEKAVVELLSTELPDIVLKSCGVRK